MTANYRNGYNAALAAIKASLNNNSANDSTQGIELDPRMTPPPTPDDNDQKEQEKTSSTNNSSVSDDSKSSNNKQKLSNNNDHKSPSNNDKPTIGSKGNQDIQDQEEAERQANAYSDDDGNILDKTSDDKQNSSSSNNISTDTSTDKNDNKAINVDPNSKPNFSRGNTIKKAFDDLRNDSKFNDETKNPVTADKEKRRAAQQKREIEKYKNASITRFKDSLNKFIRDVTQYGKNRTWSRINKTAVATGLIKKGSSRLMQSNIPMINVYFDQSGSWDSEKIKVGQQAIATLNRYVQRKEILVNLYYFSEKVHTTPKNNGWHEGGTAGQPILNHIVQTKPNNVIIMTDSDISDCTSRIEIPGAVWFLFKDGRSQNLIDHLHGKQLTKEFEI